MNKHTFLRIQHTHTAHHTDTRTSSVNQAATDLVANASALSQVISQKVDIHLCQNENADMLVMPCQLISHLIFIFLGFFFASFPSFRVLVSESWIHRRNDTLS